MKMIRTLFVFCILIVGAVSTTVATPVNPPADPLSEPTPEVPAGDLLTPDGRLRLDGHTRSRLDLSGWNVTLDPHE